MPCGFFTRRLEMIFDIMIVLFVLSLDLLSRLIGRRRDVFYFVSKRDARWPAIDPLSFRAEQARYIRNGRNPWNNPA
jgi:hypothetical protein